MPLRVLLIDDSQADLTLLRFAFEVHGHHIELLTASTGDAAMDLLRAGTPTDLIVLDLNMPGMTGFEVLHALKSHPAWQVIPVLILTTSDRDADIARSYAAQANAVMVKPAHLDDLQKLVDALLTYWQHARLVRQ